MTPVDALVIGGGPAGATAALLLARRGWRTALVEQTPFPRPKVCGEYVAPAALALLDALGLGDTVADAGPEIRRVALFVRGLAVTAAMPAAGGRYGRAIARDVWDARLLAAARLAGVAVLQPASVTNVVALGEGHACDVRADGAERSIRARVVIAAHGSWACGALPTQPLRRAARPGDLFGFKAHFDGVRLPADLLPLMSFDGGYAGLVQTSGGQANLSFCVRREALARLRARHPGERAAAAVLRALCEDNAGARQALGHARRVGPWVACGPLRPGMRPCSVEGVYAIGNAAGECHPLVGEGLAMALQSAHLFVDCLEDDGTAATYARRWRAAFGTRVLASQAYARLALRPAWAAAVARAAAVAPEMLTALARWSGKTVVSDVR